LSLVRFNKRINHYAKIIGFKNQKILRRWENSETDHLHCSKEACERHRDNAGGSRKLSAVAAGHTMEVKERHYEKVGEDFEQVHESYRKFHSVFVENWYPPIPWTMKRNNQKGASFSEPIRRMSET